MHKRTQASNRFSNKWPPEVESRGFTQVPNCLFKCRAELGLSPSELATLMQLFAHDFGSKIVWPGHARLARQAGQGLTTIRTNLRKLQQKKFIKIENKSNGNIYHLSLLIDILRYHQCKDTDRKKTQPYQYSAMSTYRNTDTKEDELKRRNNKNTGLSNIKDILGKRSYNE